MYEVPEAFKTDAKLDTTEKIKEQLKGYIALGYSEEHTQIYVTTSALGKTPGEIERPAVVKGADGLQFRVRGLSPVEVSWKAVQNNSMPLF